MKFIAFLVNYLFRSIAGVEEGGDEGYGLFV